MSGNIYTIGTGTNLIKNIVMWWGWGDDPGDDDDGDDYTATRVDWLIDFYFELHGTFQGGLSHSSGFHEHFIIYLV